MMTADEYQRIQQRVGFALGELNAAMGEAWRSVPKPDDAAVLTQAAPPPPDDNGGRVLPATAAVDISDPKLAARLTYSADALDRALNNQLFDGGTRSIGFVLLVYPYGETDPARCRFATNGGTTLRDILRLMEGQVARLNAKPAPGPAPSEGVPT